MTVHAKDGTLPSRSQNTLNDALPSVKGMMFTSINKMPNQVIRHLAVIYIIEPDAAVPVTDVLFDIRLLFFILDSSYFLDCSDANPSWVQTFAR